MPNRFTGKRRRDFPRVRALALPVALFAAVLVFFQAGASRLDRATQQEQLRGAQQAVYRACMQCYVLEGQYPPTVGYLVERYGLQVDMEAYIVHYEAFAGNLVPTIEVMPRY